jgi:HK97 gp10 family phage protein
MATLEGVETVLAQFHSLSRSMQASSLRGAIVEAAKPILKTARATAPVDTGLTKLSVRIRSSIDRNKGEATARIGVLWPAYYSLVYVERGTSHAPAKPWLVPALNTNTKAVQDLFVVSMRRRIAAALARKR